MIKFFVVVALCAPLACSPCWAGDPIENEIKELKSNLFPQNSILGVFDKKPTKYEPEVTLEKLKRLKELFELKGVTETQDDTFFSSSKYYIMVNRLLKFFGEPKNEYCNGMDYVLRERAKFDKLVTNIVPFMDDAITKQLVHCQPRVRQAIQEHINGTMREFLKELRETILSIQLGPHDEQWNPRFTNQAHIPTAKGINKFIKNQGGLTQDPIPGQNEANQQYYNSQFDEHIGKKCQALRGQFYYPSYAFKVTLGTEYIKPIDKDVIEVVEGWKFCLDALVSKYFAAKAWAKNYNFEKDIKLF